MLDDADRLVRRHRPRRPADRGRQGRLARRADAAGIAVPAGFVVRTSGLRALLEALEARGAGARRRVEALAADDLDGDHGAVARNCAARGAKRRCRPKSSGDLARAQAGALRPATTASRRRGALFRDHRGCRGRQLRRAAGHLPVGDGRARWWPAACASAGPASIRWNPSAYRRRQGMPEDGVAMAVVVQRMVDARDGRGDVHAQPDHRRPVGDHHRGRLGAGHRRWSAARSRRTASCWARSPARSRVRDISRQAHRGRCRCRRRRHRRGRDDGRNCATSRV